MTKFDVKDKKITIIGAARSGFACAMLLKSHGAKVFVSDNSMMEKVRTNIENLRKNNIDCEIGQHTDRIYDADLFVISPGVPSTSDVVKGAEARGIKILSELEIASWFCPAPIVAITGTNGKTTTTTLTGQMFTDNHFKCSIGGNIDPAFSSIIPELDRSSIAVLEVSSFQLDFIETFHPKVSVILNITPDHLDRYNGSFELYADAKCKIFKNQSHGDYLIYCYDDPVINRKLDSLKPSGIQLIPFSIKSIVKPGAFVQDGKLFSSFNGVEEFVIDISQIGIPGIHNLYNAMAAVLSAQIFGVKIPSIRATLKNFKGVEHRLEFVRELKGVKFINDSKATNVNSVWYALQAYSEPIILLLGGRDKGNDYSKLFDLVKLKVRAIIAIGESADKVFNSFQQISHVVKASSMDEAVNKAVKLARQGDIVLLSPACASFDWFNDYQHRGDTFKNIVNSLRENSTC